MEHITNGKSYPKSVIARNKREVYDTMVKRNGKLEIKKGPKITYLELLKNMSVKEALKQFLREFEVYRDEKMLKIVFDWTPELKKIEFKKAWIDEELSESESESKSKTVMKGDSLEKED